MDLYETSTALTVRSGERGAGGAFVEGQRLLWCADVDHIFEFGLPPECRYGHSIVHTKWRIAGKRVIANSKIAQIQDGRGS